MQCPNNCGNNTYLHGHFGRNKTPRFKCRDCKRTFSERTRKPVKAINLPDEKLFRILDCLSEGCSVRSTARLCDVTISTVLRVLTIAGDKCERLLQDRITGLQVNEVQADELWGFCYCKERNKRNPNNERQGDAWTFLAVERRSKLILTWHLGRRTRNDTEIFIEKLNEATSGDFQLTTDGMAAYPNAVSMSLGTRVDYSQLIKVYTGMTEGPTRYSPAKLQGTIIEPWIGNPDRELICTSHVERTNLTVRMRMRRLTRLTNGFSRKWDNMKAAVALFVFSFNFREVHRSIRCTPAMEAGVASSIWTWRDLFAAV
jgi:transposase-like protein/IS1 family transposase